MTSKVQTIFIVLCAGVVVATSLFFVNKFVVQPAQIDADIQQVQELYASAPAEKAAKKSSSAPDKFATLKKINPDIRGWLTVPGTKINYPVLQSAKSDPEHYLKYDFKNRKDDHGSVFMQAGCQPASSRNTVLYGHNMLDGTMFRDLLKYDSATFCKQNPRFSYEDSSGKKTYQIFAVIKEQNGFTRTDFQSDIDFAMFVQELQKKSIYDTGVSADGWDHIMLLCTCSYETKNNRTVVAGKLLSAT
ncbi:MULTISPECIES: class B sortase [Caproicibacterium]|uniref:Class B sortase n=1 Tax=Caproicibacterium argilliputei TaxID=3030016 RepID=A0AA97D881_9FIRM|nr:class B sortase [Caproicibacterium argilliputei]WOC32375.1 class B sortase [Caproicibacterium argilliputei]